MSRPVRYRIKAILGTSRALRWKSIVDDPTQLLRRSTQFECPACDRIGGFWSWKSRHEALCPRCGSLERHRLMVLFLERLGDLSDKRILHIAPEEPLMRRLSMYSEYYTGDLNEEDVDFRIDLADLEFEDESFDMIICNHVLEHVTDDRLALRELARVTRSEGIAVMMTPVDDSYQSTYEDPRIVDHRERRLHFGQWDHVRRYGRDFYERISEAGFDVERWHAAPEDEAKYGLVVGEDVIVGRKRAKA